MAARGKKKTKKVEDYRHKEAERLNNPPAGLAWQDTEKPVKRRFEYDPHLDPQLVWAGKAERQSFEVEAPSIHVHERLSADDIVRSVMKEPAQPALFDYGELDRTKAVDFYRHEMGWENRLILGDSLVVMTSLLDKERLGGQVQMIYIDPPYGIEYKANFQPRISSREVKDRSDKHLTREPEQIQAFRDTWSLGVHSYLSYLRDRFLLARDLLHPTGSLFVQIGVDRLHIVRSVIDEVFGPSNACSIITIRKTSGHSSSLVPEVSDFLIWYARDKKQVKYRQLYVERSADRVDDATYEFVLETDGSTRKLRSDERADTSLLPEGARVYKLDNITSDGFSPHKTVDFDFEGDTFHPGADKHWKLRVEGMEGLAKSGRLEARGETLWYRRFLDDFGGVALSNTWMDTSASFQKRRFVVHTVPKVIERCVAMTTDPGDLVVDPTCGSGTSAFVAEKLGRRWITMDTSRVALSVARERLLTAKFDYYKLRDPDRGVAGGFSYRELSRTKASAVGYSGDDAEGLAEEVVLYDRPLQEKSKLRVAGPFTVEALSRYAVNPNQDHVPPEPDDPQAAEPQDHVRTLLDALARQGIPRKGGKPAKVLRVEALANAGAVHGEGVYEDADGEKAFAVVLGPRFGPVTVQQIDEALHESYGYDLVVFAGFSATAEAQDYVARGELGKFKVALLEANPDLLVGDLLKSTPSSQTFRLFAAPDIQLDQNGDGDYSVQVLGVDLFDASTGETKFVGDEYVAAWFLDTDYDGMVFHVDQAFFPDGGWETLAKTLKGTVDEELMEQLQRFESLPFQPGEHKKAAVRVIDDAGTTSEVVLDLE